MVIEKLSNPETAQTGAQLRVFVSHEDLTEATANTAQTLPLFNVKKGTLVELVAMLLCEAFADQDDTAFNTAKVKIGDGVDDDRFLASTEINSNGAKIEGSAGTQSAFVYTADDTVDLVVASMAEKSLSNIDKGKLMLLFKVVQIGSYKG